MFDTAFGVALGSGFNGTINNLTLRDDGKILVGGNYTTYKGVPVGRIALIDSEGNLDTDFNTNIGSGFDSSFVTLIHILPDGKMYVSGGFEAFNGVATNNLARLNADGTLDTDFTEGLGLGVDGSIQDMEVRSDGALGLIGTFNLNGEYSDGKIEILVTNTPEAPSTPDLLAAYDSGSSNTDNETTQTSLVFSGFGTPNATINLLNNDSLIANTTVGDDETWSVGVTLPVGRHNISATQTLTLTNSVTSEESGVLTVNVVRTTSSGGGGGGGGGGRGTKPSLLPQTPTPLITNTPNYNSIVQTLKSLIQELKRLLTKQGKPLPPSIATLEKTLNTNSNVVPAPPQPKTTFTKVLPQGINDPQVGSLQKFLFSLGLYFGPVTNLMDIPTRTALEKYQKQRGIVSEGQVGYGVMGPTTRSYINGEVSK